MRLAKSDLQLETIVSRIEKSELDLQPDFQRGEVWEKQRRQKLIDTVLREWYIPAIHVVITETGDEQVLDGQQRLATIRDFFRGKIKVDGKGEPFDKKVMSLDGLTYDELPEETRKKINRFTIQVISLTDYSPSEPNELFFRLNQAYNLTPSEKRNALHGKARDQVKQIVHELIHSESFNSDSLGFSNSRLAYDDIIARSALAIEQGTLKIHINNNTVSEFYRTSQFTDNTLSKVRQTCHEIGKIGLAAQPKIRFNKGTLNSWILYRTRNPEVDFDTFQTLLHDFEHNRSNLKRGREIFLKEDQAFLEEVLRVYDDRASYRVTDVSSVLLRDLAITIYASVAGLAPSNFELNSLVAKVVEHPQDCAVLMNGFIQSNRWGEDFE